LGWCASRSALSREFLTAGKSISFFVPLPNERFSIFPEDK